MERPDAPPFVKASSHHLMDSLDAPPAAKASSQGASRQGLLPRRQPPPPPHGRNRGTAGRQGLLPRPPAARASSHRPVAPSSQGLFQPPPPHGQPGRTSYIPVAPPSQVFIQPPPRHGKSGLTAASWAAKASYHRPVAPSSQGLLPPPPPPHQQPGRASWTPHGQPRNAASRQISPRRLMDRPVAPPSSHRLMDTSPASKASHRYPNWVMLDPHTRLNYRPKEDFLCAHAVAETSMGEPIGVSFRTVTPPGASRLYISWTPRGRTKGESSSGAGRGEDCWDQFNGQEPIVVAAHGNSILLQLTFENSQSDFFVYTLPAAGPPSLMRLPSCNHKFTDGTPCSDGLDHMSTIEEIGLLCNAEEEKFVVADLMILPSAYKDDDMVAELCVLQGICTKDGWTTTPWRAIRPQIHDDKEQRKELMLWETDAVVPFRDSLCYVDYFRGIFFVDVLSGNPKLYYVRLPVTIPDGDPVDPETGLRGCPELYRSVCVTNDGCILKFVEVVTSTVFISGRRAPASSPFAIKVWKLTQDSMTWEKEYVMDDTELWALQGCGNLRVAPSFPLVSMEEPDVVYFVLNNRYSNDADASWVIVVDMLNKTIRSLSRYNRVYPNCIGSDDDMASASLTTNSAFIPCAFSKYLHMCA